MLRFCGLRLCLWMFLCVIFQIWLCFVVVSLFRLLFLWKIRVVVLCVWNILVISGMCLIWVMLMVFVFVWVGLYSGLSMLNIVGMLSFVCMGFVCLKLGWNVLVYVNVMLVWLRIEVMEVGLSESLRLRVLSMFEELEVELVVWLLCLMMGILVVLMMIVVVVEMFMVLM